MTCLFLIDLNLILELMIDVCSNYPSMEYYMGFKKNRMTPCVILFSFLFCGYILNECHGNDEIIDGLSNSLTLIFWRRHGVT